MEARRASVLMHPPFRRLRATRLPRAFRESVPARVRVTLRVAAVRMGTSARARGICPGTSPYPVVVLSGRLPA
ncbi:hypothetical protein GCM10010358_65780 [Streptomyces minutiscleroticus]|uniref:Uncharacterized protein n=1 Tax=Streptomyces minutiscleroticus TaxID=68238 RepID=A0A918U7D0_9ACTN|nr:hypothetical protein GCM10010358_65780 [Streptomyces minutiscleroticus]